MDICKITARHVGEAVLKRAETFDAQSRLKQTYKEENRLEWKDLVVGRLLGTGNFSSVYRVVIPKWQDEGEEDTAYALKILHPRTTSCKDSFIEGAIDLVIEARMLERLHHPNIIKLHATKGGCLSRSFIEGGYFLVLERLHGGTLHDKLRKWEEKQKSHVLRFLHPVQRLRRAASSTMNQDKDEEGIPSLLQRLEHIALGVARAMAYLHSNKICFRDLKPQNVGFKPDGTVQVFDFGLAVELSDHHCASLCEGTAGTPRYMAPENALRQPCGLPCDVYSFAHLLWEVCTLKVPYKKLSPSEHMERVVLGSERPSLKECPCSTELKHAMQACWDWSPECRLAFSDICDLLENEQESTFYSRPQDPKSESTRYRGKNPKILKRSKSLSLPNMRNNTFLASDREFERTRIRETTPKMLHRSRSSLAPSSTQERHRALSSEIESTHIRETPHSGRLSRCHSKADDDGWSA